MSITPQPSISHRQKRISAHPRVLPGTPSFQSPRVIKPLMRRRVLAVIAVMVVSAVLWYEIEGINELRAKPVIGADYVAISEYVAARHKPGEAILTALPAPVYLAVGSKDDIIFLPSPIDRERAQRYTRILADGRYVDYWTGADSVVDVAGLCNTLLTTPDIWIVLDDARLKADWAYAGPMAQVIYGMTYIQYSADGGAQVRRVSPSPARQPAAEQICAAAMAGLPLPKVEDLRPKR
jgi:hypothetical protein